MSDIQNPIQESHQPQVPEKNRRNPFTTAAIALQAKPPAYWTRMASLSVCVFALFALLFSCLVSMDVVVSTQGKVMALGKSKVIQPLEAAVIKRIAVKDGQFVKAGDVLIELDPTNASADGQRLQRELWDSQTDMQRAQALLKGAHKLQVPEGTPADIASNQQLLLQSRYQAQQAKLAGLNAEVARKRADMQANAANVTHTQESLPLLQKKADMYMALADKGYAAQTTAMEAQLGLINLRKELDMQKSRLQESKGALDGAIAQRAQARAEFALQTGMELGEAAKKTGATQQELNKAQRREELQVLRAPVDGVVQQLAVSTVGGVVTPAQPLLTIVPQKDTFEVEAQVVNRDIGQIKPGQRVIVKVETFDFTRYGYIEGQVVWVGMDAIADQKLGPVYPVRIRLSSYQTPKTGHGHKGVITAGMNVTADIKTDERRLIEYFVAPLMRQTNESLRER